MSEMVNRKNVTEFRQEGPDESNPERKYEEWRESASEGKHGTSVSHRKAVQRAMERR